MEITLQMLNDAFNQAEDETAYRFDGQTCAMQDRHGETTCPICDFRARVKRILGFEPVTVNEPAGGSEHG